MGFDIQGINHIALVCADMARTVNFYTDVLGLPLIKTIDIPGGGQHFFFGLGDGAAVAFFWFPEAPAAAPGIASIDPQAMLATGDIRTAHASMNHLALRVPLDKLEEYHQTLNANGVQTTPILHHSDSAATYLLSPDAETFISSFYFFDPDGILLEFAANTRQLGGLPHDVRHVTTAG